MFSSELRGRESPCREICHYLGCAPFLPSLIRSRTFIHICVAGTTCWLTAQRVDSQDMPRRSDVLEVIGPLSSRAPAL